MSKCVVMGILFGFLIRECRPVPFSSLVPRPNPCVHQSFLLSLHKIPVEMKFYAWTGKELGLHFSISLICIIGEQYSRDPERTESQIFMYVFLKFSMGKSKLGSSESE